MQDNEKLDDDGIQLEPFNLDKEREEGYFDSAGNFVEYVNKTDDIKVLSLGLFAELSQLEYELLIGL